MKRKSPGPATKPGRSFPLRATVSPEGVNFSVFSKGATGVELLLFGEMDAPQPEQVIALDPCKHRTYHYWHVFVPGAKAGPAPGDICKEIEAVPVEEPTYLAQPRSVILLFSTLNQSGSGTIHSEGFGRKSP